MKEFELVGGPQDGAKVRRVGEVMPQTIYVGRKYLGDAYAAWSSEPSKRFVACYTMDGSKFVFKRFAKYETH